MIPPNQTTTPEVTNATNSLVPGEPVTYGVLLVIYMTIFSTFVFLVLGRAREYKWLRKIGREIASTLEYFFFGLVTLIIIGLIALPLYLVPTVSQETVEAFGVTVILVVIGYLTITLLGYISSTVWEKIAENHEEITGHRPFEKRSEEVDE